MSEILTSRQMIMLQVALAIISREDATSAIGHAETLTNLIMGGSASVEGMRDKGTGEAYSASVSNKPSDHLLGMISNVKYTQCTIGSSSDGNQTKVVCDVVLGDSGITVSGSSQYLRDSCFDPVAAREHAYEAAVAMLFQMESYHEMRNAERSLGAAESLSMKKEAGRMFAEQGTQSGFAGMKQDVQ